MYNIAILGSGPGGYVAAIRAKQLGLNVVLIEKENLGGTCLNWGCIPTKALLKSASVYNTSISKDFGIANESTKINFNDIINRSRLVAQQMNKGVQFLIKKNKIDVVYGYGKLIDKNNIEVTDKQGEKSIITAENIILATGSHSRNLPNIKQDGNKIIGYKEAMSLEKQPENMLVIGSGAIGTELAYFYQTLGTNVTLVEFLPDILPLEDQELTKALTRELKKMKMKVMTSSTVTAVDTTGEKCKVTISTPKEEQVLETDIVLMAAGIETNITNIGLEELGIKTEKGKVLVNEKYQTNVENIYAIGDIVPGAALAHVASAEGVNAVEHIAGLNPKPIDYNYIPSCIFCEPEIASIGYTEKQAIDANYEIKVGKFPFLASGKATASGAKAGMVKLIFDCKTDILIGAHLMGEGVTEMISGLALAIKLKATSSDISQTIHPHPTMSEAIMEAALDSNKECIHA
ncbi:MAG: dihydrolipoyl dehydrogenase [Bacteroidales bacterium]|jgi:dihydrolipoamide dehydrogenase